MVIAVIVLAVVLAFLALFGLIAIVAFNKLRRADIAAQEALGGIDVQLTRRADLIPNLVNTVKGYAGHEREVLEQVTAARAGVARVAGGTAGVADRAAADGMLEQALGRLFAVAENYPQLQASGNFLELQRELSETERSLSFARQFYNDAVARLNGMVRTIPWLLFAPMAGVKVREFYQAPAGQAAPPQVQF